MTPSITLNRYLTEVFSSFLERNYVIKSAAYQMQKVQR